MTIFSSPSAIDNKPLHNSATSFSSPSESVRLSNSDSIVRMQVVTLSVCSGLALGFVIVSCAAADPVLGGGDEPDTAHSGIGGGEPDKFARRRFAFTQSISARTTDRGDAADRTSAPDVT